MAATVFPASFVVYEDDEIDAPVIAEGVQFSDGSVVVYEHENGRVRQLNSLRDRDRGFTLAESVRFQGKPIEWLDGTREVL